jgi:hypothetical protein
VDRAGASVGEKLTESEAGRPEYSQGVQVGQKHALFIWTIVILRIFRFFLLLAPNSIVFQLFLTKIDFGQIHSSEHRLSCEGKLLFYTTLKLEGFNEGQGEK